MTGDYILDTTWRWAPDAEQKLVAAKPRPSANLTPSSPAIVQTNAPAWAEFRGPDRAGRSSAPPIDTNWTARPPRQLWKIAVGPGWSSFAVAGHALYTQEQRGPMEAVVCYDSESGREVWRREFEGRLEDPLGGPGPRATPTLAGGALFVVGPTGILARLNPATGEIIWRRDLAKAANRAVPMWGFAGSPLVTGGLIITYAGGADNKGVLAFDARSGDLRWSAPAGNDSYSSPQLSTIAGEKSVLMLSNDGLMLLNPATGEPRFNYDWKVSAYRALQPAVVNGDTVLLQTPMNTGTRAVRFRTEAGKLMAEDLWTSRNLKTDFSDLVTFEGHAYGNDNGFLACLDLQTGERKWKGGRYGKGQFLLLERSRLLLVLTEQGQVILVPADPNGHSEIASFKALEGKTWNHPVVVNDRLYVRNSEQAAAYILPLAGSAQ
jgi:outer membrane protein assembly factor BamB